MKKIFCLILTLAICLGAGILLVGCDCDHVFAEEWQSDDTYHWRVCTGEDCTEQSDKAEHDWDDGVQTLAPTATSNGVLKYTCKTCSRVKTQTLAADPIVSEPEWADAFLMQDDNYWMTVVTTNGNFYVKKRNGIAVMVDPQSAGNRESYFVVEGEKYYRYDKAVETVTKREITKQEYEQAITLIDLQGLAYGDFVYNEQGKVYTAAQLTLESVVYENVYIAFAGNKITRITFVKKEEGKSTETYNINVTYGTVKDDIVLPQVTG